MDYNYRENYLPFISKEEKHEMVLKQRIFAFWNLGAAIPWLKIF